MKIRTLFDTGIVLTFGGWLIATVLSQHPESTADRVRRLDDRFGNTVIPNWRFFAPNPAVEDVRLLYRFANEDRSSHTEWIECETISPRKLHQVIWFPRRRLEKAIFDAHQSLMMATAKLSSGGDPYGLMQRIIDDNIKLIDNFVREVSNPTEDWVWQQVLLVRFAGNDPDAAPAYDYLFEYAPISPV